MFAINTYEEIEKTEKYINEKHIIVLLFVRPSLNGANNIINEFNYLHYNSSKYCSIYAVGYSNSANTAKYHDFIKVRGIKNKDWYYSDQAFVAFKNKLEQRLNWHYSGDIELIVLQSNPDSENILNFQHYLAIDINYGIRNEYIDSFPRFMESLIRSSRKEVEAVPAINQVRRSRYRLSEIVCQAIDECKKVPFPIKRIAKDRLFYRTARSYSK